MKFYKFLFEGDYHAKADGSHEVKVIQRGLDGIEWAYGYGIEVPEYAEEIDGIKGWEAPVPTIPTSIAKWQAKLLLLDMGILSNVEALIAQNPSPEMTRRSCYGRRNSTTFGGGTPNRST